MTEDVGARAERESRILRGLPLDYERVDGVFDGVPRDEAAEDALIVAVLKQPAVLDGLDLEPRDFWGLRYRVCWSAILRLHRRGEPIDFVTLGQELRRLGREDGHILIADLWQTNGLAADARVYLERIKEMRDRRRLIYSAQRIAEKAWDSENPLTDVLRDADLLVTALRRETAQPSTASALPDVDLLAL